jgi:hypothetical protein
MIYLRRLGRKHIDFEFSVNDEVRARVLERPGLWMSKGKLQAILDEMRAVVATTVDGGLEYGVLSGDKRRLDAALISLVYDRKSRAPIGFNAMSLLDIEFRGQPAEVLHLGLVMVDPRHRTQGLAWVLAGLPCLLMFLRRRLAPLWVTCVTQVPAVFGAVAEGYSQVFPAPGAPARRTFNHLAVARELMRRHRSVFGVGPEAEFDDERFIIRNSYTGGSQQLMHSYEEVAKHRADAANVMCGQHLDYVRGDDFLQVGIIDYTAAYNYLTRMVPRDTLPYLLSRISLLVLARLIAPVLQWLTPDKQLGDLRPWHR